MGASQSIPSVLTREKAFELTKNTRNVMNILLEYMLKEITVRDFLLLSNPTECKKYILFMANNLYKHFYELQIQPVKDKKGVIAFRPIKELINPPESGQEERQSLCLILAYYYTRIFQIYGALALTLIDDATYMTESGLLTNTTYYDSAEKRGLLPPGYRPYTTIGGDTSLGGYITLQNIQDGGAIPASVLGNFNFLRSYLVEPKTSKGFLTRYSGDSSSQGLVYFQRPLQTKNEYGRYIVENTDDLKTQKGIFTIAYQGAKDYAYLEVFAKPEGIGSTNIKFQFGKIKYNKKGQTTIQTIDISSDIIPNKTLIIISQRLIGQTSYSFSIKGSEASITDYFNDIFIKLIPFIKAIVEEDYSVTSKYDTTSTVSETGAAEELKLARTIQNLTKTKPLGHCLARALQLLKVAPFKGELSESFICKAKFFDVVTKGETISTRSGIPPPNSSLDTSPGLAALSQLFYDTINIGSPKIVIGTNPRPDGKLSSIQQYTAFMKIMARIFGDDTNKSSTNLISQGLKGIKNRRDKELCGSITGAIPVTPNTAKTVYEVVNQLYRTQVEHAARCGEIFKQLFNIQQDKNTGRFRITLSDNIIKKGLPEIDRVNYLARDVLIKYYTECELKYMNGMKIVLSSKKTEEKLKDANIISTPIVTNPSTISPLIIKGKPKVAPV